MPTDMDPPQGQELPGWALDQAADELHDVHDETAIVDRAKDLVREARQRQDERHDEYDDPDQGGEG